MKKLTAILLIAAMLLSLTGCPMIEKMQFESGLKNGDFHVLVPEGDHISHEDGTFQDFDTYCVFTGTGRIDSQDTRDYDHIAAYGFHEHPDSPGLEMLSYEHEGTTYYINIYQNTDKTVVIAGTELPGWEEGWAFVELPSGQIPPHPSTLLPYESAPAEVLDGRTIYTLDTASWSDVVNYGDYLSSEGGWIYCTDLYDNNTDQYRVIAEYRKDGTHLMLLWYNGITKVIVSEEDIEDSEESLWDMVGGSTTIEAGEQYMREQIMSLGLSAYDGGEGYDMSGGVVYRYTYNGSMDLFNELVSNAQSLGFTEDITQTSENGVSEFSAWREDTYGGGAIMFFVHIIFDGEYLEAQMGKNADQVSHRGG